MVNLPTARWVKRSNRNRRQHDRSARCRQPSPGSEPGPVEAPAQWWRGAPAGQRRSGVRVRLGADKEHVMTTKKTAAKTASKPAEPKRTVDVRAQFAAWHRAQQHIDTIDAQTGPDAVLPARETERLAVERAGHVAAQEAAEAALASLSVAVTTKARRPL